MEPTSSTSDDLGTQFELLADPRRRLAIALLAVHELPLTLRDLAVGIVTRERGTSLPDVPSDAVVRVHTSLAHAHVPKLADLGLIEYDPKRTRIVSAELDDLQPALSVVLEADPRLEPVGLAAE